jgi:hypothetical protein
MAKKSEKSTPLKNSEKAKQKHNSNGALQLQKSENPTSQSTAPAIYESKNFIEEAARFGKKI